MAKQGELLIKIVKSLIEAYNDSPILNEATFKHNFFYYLKLKNPKYLVSVEENLWEHVKVDGRADYYLDDNFLGSSRETPFAFNYNPNNLPNGFHTLKVSSFDDIDNSTSAQVNFNLFLNQ